MRRIVLSAAILAVSCSSLWGQASVERFNRQLDQLRIDTLLRAPQQIPAGERVLLDYGAYFTFDYISLDGSRQDNHVLREYDFTPYVRLNIDNAQELFVRGRLVYRDFNDGDSFDGRGDRLVSPDVDRAYYRFDLARYLAAYKGKQPDGDLVFKGGRDLVYWANGLVLAQVLDGAVLDLSKGPFTVEGIAGVTPSDTIDFDPTRPNFDIDTRRGFYGVMASMQVGAHRPFIYGLLQTDYNKDSTYTTANISTKFDYSSYYLGAGSEGNLGDKMIYGAEVVYEGGRSLSNSFEVGGPFLTPVSQTYDDINAFAADARIDYLFNDSHRTRAGAEMILATGDDDRLNANDTFGGNRTHTSDRAFNAFGLLNTGLAFAPSVSNLAVFRIGASTFPLNDISLFRRLQLGTDLFFFNKLAKNAPIDEPTLDQRWLGFEPDVYLNWEITSDVTLAVRYGVFLPSGSAFVIDSARQFVSTSITFAF